MGCIRYDQYIISILSDIINIYHYNGPSPYLIFNPYIPRVEARVAAAPKIGAGLTGQRASQETRVLEDVARDIFSGDEKKLLGPRIQVCYPICYMIILLYDIVIYSLLGNLLYDYPIYLRLMAENIMLL